MIDDRTSSNPHLLDFAAFPRPETKTAALVYDAAVSVPGGLYDHCVVGNLMAAAEPTEPFMSAYGTPKERAAERVRKHVAKVRAEADRLEGILRTYGGGAFVEGLVPVRNAHRAVESGRTTLSDVIHRVARASTHIRANGVMLRRKRTGGGFERADTAAA